MQKRSKVESIFFIEIQKKETPGKKIFNSK